MLKKYGVTANELRIVGGGSKNRLWRRIIADSFQLPLRFPTEPESAALGAALQAAAVHVGMPVNDFVESHAPPLEDEVQGNAALPDHHASEIVYCFPTAACTIARDSLINSMSFAVHRHSIFQTRVQFYCNLSHVWIWHHIQSLCRSCSPTRRTQKSMLQHFNAISSWVARYLKTNRTVVLCPIIENSNALVTQAATELSLSCKSAVCTSRESAPSKVNC